MTDGRSPVRTVSRRGAQASAMLGFALLASAAWKAGPAPVPESGRAETLVIVVAGNAPWTDTGLEVSAGDPIAFDAEGKITLQKGNPEAECGPDGYDLQTMQQPLTGRNLGALIGKVVIGVTVLVNEKTKEETQRETAELFYVGSKSRLEMPAKGRLYLGINENVIGDNAGEFRVTVSTASSGQGPGSRREERTTSPAR